MLLSACSGGGEGDISTDDTVPVLTAPAAVTIISDTAIPASDTRIQVFLSAATANDAEDGDISARITHDITNGYTFNVDETKTVQFTVTDNDGNEALATVTIRVQSPSSTIATGKLNDTGIIFGGGGGIYQTGNNIDCSGLTINQQDCSHGRDFTHNDDSDGHAGFSYTKLDANGNPLAASATEWSCVLDHVTGLVWEVKTYAEGGIKGLRDATWTYVNTTNMIGYDPRDYEDSSACLASSSNSDGIYCHTEGYRTAVNIQGLCGASDWRMPTMNELEGLVNFNHENLVVDNDYFPNVPNSSSVWFWSSSPGAYRLKYAWYVDFNYGGSDRINRGNTLSVRLVRSGQ